MACVKAHITMMPTQLRASISRASKALSIGISRVKTKLCLSVERTKFVVRTNLFIETLKAEITNVTTSLNVSCDVYCDIVPRYYLEVIPKEEQWIIDNTEYQVISDSDWFVVSDVDWMQLHKGYNNVVVSVSINEGIDRSGTITFIGGELRVTRKVLQIGMREVFNEDFILADGGTFNVLKDEL